MNTEDYFREVVLPLYSSFTEKNSIANLYAALTTTYHMVDYIATDLRSEIMVSQKHVSTVRDEIIRLCPEFHSIYCVALAQKHVVVSNRHAEHGLTAADIERPKGTFIGVNGKGLMINGKPFCVLTGYNVMIGGKKVRLEESLSSSVILFGTSLDQVMTSVEKAFVKCNL